MNRKEIAQKLRAFADELSSKESGQESLKRDEAISGFAPEFTRGDLVIVQGWRAPVTFLDWDAAGCRVQNIDFENPKMFFGADRLSKATAADIKAFLLNKGYWYLTYGLLMELAQWRRKKADLPAGCLVVNRANRGLYLCSEIGAVNGRLSAEFSDIDGENRFLETKESRIRRYQIAVMSDLVYYFQKPVFDWNIALSAFEQIAQMQADKSDPTILD